VARSGGPESHGGVVMVNFYSGFISEAWRNAWNAQAPERQAAEKAQIAAWKAQGKTVTYGMVNEIDRQWAAKIPRPPLSMLIDHIDHIAKVAGIDHVGLDSLVAGRNRLRGRSAEDHRGADGAGLLARGLPQDPGRELPALLPRCAGDGSATPAGIAPAPENCHAAAA